MKDYLSTKEAAKKIGCAAQTLTKRISRGKLKAKKTKRPLGQPGNRIILLIHKDDVEKLVGQIKPRRQNRSRIRKPSEVWEVFSGSFPPVFSGSFNECLKHKTAKEVDTGEYHTMRMVGGQRGQAHATTAGKRWAEIDRYAFQTGKSR